MGRELSQIRAAVALTAQCLRSLEADNGDGPQMATSIVSISVLSHSTDSGGLQYYMIALRCLSTHSESLHVLCRPQRLLTPYPSSNLQRAIKLLSSESRTQVCMMRILTGDGDLMQDPTYGRQLGFISLNSYNRNDSETKQMPASP
ncbi:hypothetical protein FIBSPDRAFT_165753 [Athelia psychrophila]|uniref:Uncharacterized protein n=1 Tax=Athelia psychrophila TaxID=1759441 RepID=A0A166B487_9AGAM|nr:hypothetical protein FIBSPDRAFT_165753 [Fibularhizoctonia sp. CBS 109695]